jgi:hypothetical protein
MKDAIEKIVELQEPLKTEPISTTQDPLIPPRKKARRSTGRRRRNTTFKMPKHVAMPVRGLWESAGEEERQKAHQAGVAILEMWLGQASRKEVAQRLEVPVLRVWQLSQQALTGLVAGLLKQPRMRGVIEKPEWEQSPWKLKAKIAKLEKEVDSLRSLVDLLRAFPIHREIAREREVDRARTRTKKACHSRRNPKSNRKKTPARRSGQKRARGRGSSPRSQGADVKKLDEERTGAAETSRASSARQSDPLSSGKGGGSPAQTSGC